MTFQEILEQQLTTSQLIQRFLINLAKVGQDKRTIDLFQSRLELLETYWSKFMDHHFKLTTHKEYSTSTYLKEDVFAKVEESYLNAKTELRQKIRALSLPSTVSTDNENKRASARLPKVSVPTFSGDYLQWENFRDLFVSVVHNSPELSDAARLQYLKSLLTGEAARLISSLTITDANYEGAWKSLVERYDDKRMLMTYHLNRVLSIKAATSESASELKRLFDSTAESRRALQNLGRPVEHWDDWFVHLTVNKLDHVSRKDWEISVNPRGHIPTFQELSDFLLGRIHALDATPPRVVLQTTSRNRVYSQPSLRTHAAKTEQSTFPTNCSLCHGKHYIGYCADFKRKTPKERRDLAVRFNLCSNCLRGHPTESCTSSKRCSTCSADHHSLLHLDGNPATHQAMRSLSSAHAMTKSTLTVQPTLLATALVKVIAPRGNVAVVRALLDQGSEATFISEDLAQRLYLPRTKVHVPVTGMGATPCGTVKALVHVELSSCVSEDSPTVKAAAFVLPNLVKAFRPHKISPCSWPHLASLELSDAGSSSSNIDLVLGADLYGYILRDGLVKGPPGTPVAQNTIFGWVLSGRMEDSSPTDNSVTNFHCSVDLSLSDELRKFWEIEEVPQSHPLTPEEKLCEEHFLNTHTRTPEGRFVVRLPRRQDVPLGNSFQAALRSFQRNEVRRQSSEPLREAYQSFMQEYLDLGHMSALTPELSSSREKYYLPHHAVWKSDGSNSKIRVVFNASARTSSGHSLNDTLLPGPKLQKELSHIILRWRIPAYVFATDIVKMFRQILVHPEDQTFQRILWRDKPEDRLAEYQLKPVTYGTTCAPYLALRCLQQLADDEDGKFPEAAQVLRNQTYVDDILSGADTLELMNELKSQLETLLMAGGFHLAKWSFNSPELSGDVHSTHIFSDGTVKTLGILWNPSTDSFGFRVHLETPSTPTKRKILSCIAKLFDPLGWLAPILITAKLFIQDLWTVKVDWDAPLAPDLESSWLKYYTSLEHLEQVQIPRWIHLHPTSSYEIHGFCDASNRAYAAAVYLRVVTPLMGQLPASRITPSRPFLHTGLDYAGPVSLRTARGRGCKIYKGYIALLVCMATKAVHLEAASDCTTAAFLAAFKRFCARRGIPATLFSDQATNFRGADAELQSLFDGASKESRRIAELVANDGTTWTFIPPHSPHFGGLWEAGVKSVKYHLRRTVGDVPLTFEELTTVLAEIEACLNSRPLTPLSPSPKDPTALTPGHFLVGFPLRTIPEPSLSDVPANRLNRWQLLRRLYEQFWRRWSSEYLHQLQQRVKWRAATANLMVDDLVLVKEDNLPPSKWCLARITQIHPGADGIVRVATVKTATSELRRPVVKLCKLPAP